MTDQAFSSFPLRTFKQSQSAATLDYPQQRATGLLVLDARTTSARITTQVTGEPL